MSTQEIISTVFAVLMAAGMGWLSEIAKAIKALERSVAVIAANSENLERRVAESETQAKEQSKSLVDLKMNCAMYHHHRRDTDPGANK
jgi:uncharacterized protein YoxC